MTALPTWVHIGLTKTGTTTLQQLVLPRHEQILYLGRFVTENLNNLSHQLAIMPCDRFDKQRAAIYLEEVSSRQSKFQRVRVFSEEALSYAKQLPPEIGAARVRQLFPDARILIVLRNPFEWLQSIYFFNLKRRKPEALKRFNDWLAAELSIPSQSSELSSLAIDRLCAGYVDLFGSNSIEVLFYEDFRSDAEKFLRRLSSILGIDPARTIQLYKSSPRRRFNLRLTASQEDFCRKFELVTNGRYCDYVREIMPLIEQLPPDQQHHARQMLPPQHASDTVAFRSLRAVSRFIDGAAYSVLSPGKTAAALFDPLVFREVRERVEEGYRRAGTALGVNVGSYFEEPFDGLLGETP